jgi:CBS domain-containing protein
MITARSIMSTRLITLTPDTSIVEAARLLLDNKINGAPVVDDKGRLLGIICQSDLIAQQKKIPIPTLFAFLDSVIPLGSQKQIEKQVRKIAALTVADAMTREPVSVHPDSGIETVAALMVDSNLHTLPVVEDSRLVGVIGKEDVLRTLLPSPEND